MIDPATLVRFSLPKIGMEPGVYFLWQGADLQYVGQSVAVLHRIASHCGDGAPLREGAFGVHKRSTWFDSFSYVAAPAEDLRSLERHYLDTLIPPRNRDTRTARLRRERGHRD